MAALAIAAILLWVFGSALGRVVGGGIAFYALIQLANSGNSVASYRLLAIGAAVWIAGHWLFAFKHRVWRSRFALLIFSQPIAHRFAPIPTDYQPRRSRTRSWREEIERHDQRDSVAVEEPQERNDR